MLSFSVFGPDEGSDSISEHVSSCLDTQDVFVTASPSVVKLVFVMSTPISSTKPSDSLAVCRRDEEASSVASNCELMIAF